MLLFCDRKNYLFTIQNTIRKQMNVENFNESLFGVKPLKNSVIQLGEHNCKWTSNQK